MLKNSSVLAKGRKSPYVILSKMTTYKRFIVLQSMDPQLPHHILFTNKMIKSHYLMNRTIGYITQ